MNTSQVIEQFSNICTKKHYKKAGLIKVLLDDFSKNSSKDDALLKIINLMPNSSTIKVLFANYNDFMIKVIKENNLQKENIASTAFKYRSYESIIANFFKGKLNKCLNDQKFTFGKFCNRECWKEYNKKQKELKLLEKRKNLLSKPLIDHTKEFDEHALDHVSDDQFMKAIQSCLKPGEKLFSARRAKIMKTKAKKRQEKEELLKQKQQEELQKKKQDDLLRPAEKSTDATILAKVVNNNANIHVDEYRWGIMSPSQMNGYKKLHNLKTEHYIKNSVTNALKKMKPLTDKEREEASKYVSDKDMNNIMDIFVKSNGDLSKVTSYLDTLI